MSPPKVPESSLDSEYGVLTGLVGSDDQIRMLRAFLGSSWQPAQKKWLVDNRSVSCRPKRDPLMQLVELTTQFHAKVDDWAVAWVAGGPCTLSLAMLEEALPFHFERFDDIETAHDWLMGQEVYDRDRPMVHATRYSDVRLGPELGFSRRPFLPVTDVEIDPDLMMASGWALAHDGDDAPATLSERSRRALAARVAEALAEVEDD